ncbi:Uncharacterised protein [Mycobacteroides abscessus subsp. abscessus]|nr:Uncharacterised protein [Mycobacteroides abscessus subsp. abscessus]
MRVGKTGGHTRGMVNAAHPWSAMHTHMLLTAPAYASTKPGLPGSWISLWEHGVAR